jgi:predicted aldo/keto reductase-like oxidoreductase
MLGHRKDVTMQSLGPRYFRNLGFDVNPLGLGSSYGLDEKGVERAFDRGVNFFLWGSRRRDAFGHGLRNLARDPERRERMAIAVQSYTRVASLMEWSVDRALRALSIDHVDVLTLAWWNGPIPQRILEAAVALREKQKVNLIMASCHHRPNFAGFIADPTYDALMIRYNAAHPGAEREVFPLFEQRRPGTVAFTATRWGTLIEAGACASDCYRFALSNPNVDVCLAGPRDEAELDEALTAVERGPLDEDEMARMRAIGQAVRDANRSKPKISALDLVDRAARFSICAPKQMSSSI